MKTAGSETTDSDCSADRNDSRTAASPLPALTSLIDLSVSTKISCICGEAIRRPRRGPTPHRCARCRREAKAARERKRYGDLLVSTFIAETLCDIEFEFVTQLADELRGFAVFGGLAYARSADIAEILNTDVHVLEVDHSGPMAIYGVSDEESAALQIEWYREPVSDADRAERSRVLAWYARVDQRR